MLIKALCDYYDDLARDGKILPPGYSNVKINYKIALSLSGKISGIIPYNDDEKTGDAVDKKGKGKKKPIPKQEIMPQRTEKTGIDANVIEHRPLYIFGLNFSNGTLTPEDRTGKAKKSHAAFVEKNLKFIEGLDSQLINAYRSFLEKWEPSAETENGFLLSLGKAYESSGFVFCLDGYPELTLHQDEQIKERWETVFAAAEDSNDGCTAQCAISGETAPIARIHSKIKGIYGGSTTGSTLIGYKYNSTWSYGNEQAYNSNISETAMKQYTEALNYLLNDNKHKASIDDMTIVFWASGGEKNESCADCMLRFMYGGNDGKDAKETDDMLLTVMEIARRKEITAEDLSLAENADKDVDFYIMGLKPNASRLSLKFIYRKRFGELLMNIARFQNDLQIGDKFAPVPMSWFESELIYPKSQNKKVDPSLSAEIFRSVIQDAPLPNYLLSTLVRRVKKDVDKDVNSIRAGGIKACLNRKSRLTKSKEEITLSLNLNNTDQAYLCGRLFATLENLQKEASKSKLNRTIKDAYFASASSAPVLVFPKLIRLAQNHLRNVNRTKFYEDLIGEIISKLDNQFKYTLSLEEQGKFIIGYYQQRQFFFNGTDTDNADENDSDKNSAEINENNTNQEEE